MAAESNSNIGLLEGLAPLRVLRDQANLSIAIRNLGRQAADQPSPVIAQLCLTPAKLPEVQVAPEALLAEQSASLEHFGAIQDGLSVPLQPPQQFTPPDFPPAQPYISTRSTNPAVRLLRWLLRPLRRVVYGSFAGRIVYELDHNSDIRIATQTARLEHRLEELTSRQFEPLWQALRDQAEHHQQRSDRLEAAFVRQHELLAHLFDVMGQQVARLDAVTAIFSANADALTSQLGHLGELQATLGQRQIVALEQATALIVGGQSDQSARLDAVGRKVAAAAEVSEQSLGQHYDRLTTKFEAMVGEAIAATATGLEQALTDHQDNLVKLFADQGADLAKQARALNETVESSSKALQKELDERTNRRDGENKAAARQLLESIGMVRASLAEGLKQTLSYIDNLGRQQEKESANLAATMLGQVANGIQQASNSLDHAFGNRILDLRGAVNDGFGRLAGQISSVDAQQAKLLNAAQVGIERSLLGQQMAIAELGQEIGNRLANESHADRETVREQLLAQVGAIAEQGGSRWDELESRHQQVIESQLAAIQHMGETLGFVRNEEAARLSALQNIMLRLEAFAAASAEKAEPLPNLSPEQLGRIESYTLASARRMALPVGAHRVLVRTEVGYMICPTDDTPLLAHLIDAGELEPGTRILIEKLLNPGDVFLDVGANIGMHTITAARRVGKTGAVFAIEPFATSFEAMLESAAINGLLSQIHPTLGAAWNDTGEAELYLGITSGHHSLIKPVDQLQSKPGTVVVKTFPLDTVVPRDRTITLAKFDVEGVELEALEGARSLFDRCPDAGLIIEYGKAHLDARNISTTAWFGRIEAMGFDQCYLIEPQTGALLPGTPAGCAAAGDANLLFLRSGSNLWERVA